MDIDLMAKMKSYEEFIQAFQEGDEKIEKILINALGNKTLSDRYKISKFLIEKGADVKEISSQGYSSLQVLLGQIEHNLNETLELCQLLLEHGVDVNHKDMYEQVAFLYLIRMPKFSDDDLMDLYNLFLSQPNLVLQDTDKYGRTPFDFAESRTYRKQILERMKEYVSKKN